ncbi:unnamed protein product [Acanthoscelides obtectus]|uniref:Uncharacterized protein n=1 Tax=Acanthoscelides obtectus TaxID=200917 RepID=A0A9P0KWZ3_ACAOB|nr:unnamed protein product [Acanthoscelides obtectus]CAK1653504.1 hypothetical protein AOBTE_LOCUS18263 [Acanthoscelides obtectus]
MGKSRADLFGRGSTLCAGADTPLSEIFLFIQNGEQ